MLESMDANFSTGTLPDFVKLQRLQSNQETMGYRIPINVMLAEVKEINLNIRFNLTASKCIYEANKWLINSA